MKISLVAVGTRGDVEPHMALGARLMGQGHQVKLAAPIDFAQQSLALGFDFHPISVSFRALYRTTEGAALLACGNRSLQFIKELKRVASPVAGQVISDINDACRGADAVCYSLLGLPAYYFAKDLGIPSVATSLQPMGRTRSLPSPLFSADLPLPGSLNRMTYFIVEQVFWQFFRPLMKPWLKATIPFWGHFNDIYRSNSPMLFAYSPALVPKPRDFNPRMHVTGFWTLPLDSAWKPPASLADFLSSGPPPVCIGFGSMNSGRVEEIVDTARQAISGTGKRALLLTGWWEHRLGTKWPGDNVYVIDAVPHIWLFPKVAAVVHHGGAGTIAAALRAGVPSVVVPFFFDQWFWGQWLYRQRLGPAPIPFASLSVRSLKKALEEVENGVVFGQNLQILSRQLREEDGVQNAVTVLSDVLSRL